MDDVTQNPVDEAADGWSTGFRNPGIWPELARDQQAAMDATIEAAIRYGAQRALEAAQRPPVSPEVREELATTKVPIIYPGGTRMVDLGYPVADALLARFSFPSQPVYDEEAIAKWLCSQSCARVDGSCWRVGTSAERDEHRADAAALVAALQSGELTREETNE